MEQESKKQLYEIGYLIAPSMLEEEARDFHQKIKNEAQGLGGLIEDEGRVEKIRLSYPIKKQTEAYLGNFKFTMESAKIDEFNLKIKTEKNILRFLCVKTVRPQQRKINTRPFSAPQTFLAPQTPKEIKLGEPTANIEEIDKKLEEILGK